MCRFVHALYFIHVIRIRIWLFFIMYSILFHSVLTDVFSFALSIYNNTLLLFLPETYERGVPNVYRFWVYSLKVKIMCFICWIMFIGIQTLPCNAIKYGTVDTRLWKSAEQIYCNYIPQHNIVVLLNMYFF